jgi:transposase
MKRTYEELEAELATTQTELASIQKLLKQALDEIAKLKEQIKCNSKNSSKSPSTDQKGNTPDKDKKERATRTGKARPLFPSERIDRHIACTQDNCPHCGSGLIQLSNHPAEVLHQAELPEVKAVVTEYQLLKYQCNGCGKNSTAGLPAGIPDSAFGPKLMGLIATLTGVFHLAKREAIQLIKELYGVDMSVGSIPNIEERVTKALDPIYQRVYNFVIESKCCKHFDETGWRDSGKRHFAWIASCSEAAFYRIDRERSSAAFQRLIRQCPKKFTAVTDRYAVYNLIGVHQYCLAHLIRDFKKYAERDGPDKEIGEALVQELKTVCHIHGEYRTGKIEVQQRNRQLGRHKRKVQTWLEDGMANGSDQLYRLSETLLDDFDKLWAFTKNAGMEPTNNMAERDLRKLVIWRKKSYGTRSARGQRFVERITTVAQTARKRGKDVLGLIQEALTKFYAGVMPHDIFEALKV